MFDYVQLYVLVWNCLLYSPKRFENELGMDYPYSSREVRVQKVIHNLFVSLSFVTTRLRGKKYLIIYKTYVEELY